MTVSIPPPVQTRPKNKMPQQALGAKTFHTGHCLQKHLIGRLPGNDANWCKIRIYDSLMPDAVLNIEVYYKISARRDANLAILSRYRLQMYLRDIPQTHFTLSDDTLCLMVEEIILFLRYCHSSNLTGLLPSGGFSQ